MENKFVRTIFKTLPVVYLSAALIAGMSYVFVNGKTVGDNKFDGFAVILGAILAEAILLTIYKIIESVKSEKKLHIACFAIIALYTLGLIFSSVYLKFDVRSDLTVIHYTALNYVETGKWNQFYYFSIYPFQKNWLLVVTALYKIENMVGISDYRILPVALNVVMMVFGAVLVYKIADKLLGIKAALISLVILVFSPINYGFVSYYYTFVPGLFFTLLVIYLSLFDKWYAKLLMGIAAAVGYEMRATVGIAFVAVTLYALFKHEKGFWRGILISVLSFIVCIKGFSAIVNSLDFELVATPFSAFHWVAMGTTGGSYNTKLTNADGKFDNSHDMLVNDFRYIAEFYGEKGPTWIFRLFRRKFGQFFGKTTVRHVFGAVTYHSTFYKYFIGNKRLFTDYYSESVRLAALFNVLVGAIKIGKEKMNKTYPIFIFVFGYTLFYTFWEIAPRYSFPMLPVLWMISAHGLEGLNEKIRIYAPKTRGAFKECAVFLCAVLVVFESVFVINYSRLTEIKDTNYIAANSEQHRSVKEERTSRTLKEGEVAKQTFHAYISFDSMDLYFEKNENDGKENIYLFELFDESGNLLYDREFKSEDLKGGKMKFKFDEISVSSKTKFSFDVSVKEKEEGTDCLAIVGSDLSYEKRNAYFDGYADYSDLNQIYFKAYRIVTEPYYTNTFIFAVMAVVLLLGLVPIVYLLKRMKRCETASTT